MVWIEGKFCTAKVKVVGIGPYWTWVQGGRTHIKFPNLFTPLLYLRRNFQPWVRWTKFVFLANIHRKRGFNAEHDLNLVYCTDWKLDQTFKLISPIYARSPWWLVDPKYKMHPYGFTLDECLQLWLCLSGNIIILLGKKSQSNLDSKATWHLVIYFK